MTMTTLTCPCGKDFDRRTAEVRRAERLGRPQFCSKPCSTSFLNRTRAFKPSAAHLDSANKRDEYSPFRSHLTRLSSRRHEVTIDLVHLKALWDEQGGICPLTGWTLELPETAHRTGERISPKAASLDRINNALGYIPGNVRWIACMANLARNGWSDEDVIEFGRAVAFLWPQGVLDSTSVS